MDPVQADFFQRLLDISLDRTLYSLGQHYGAVTWAFLGDLVTDYALYLISALGLYVLFFAGQVSLGHAGLVGIAAYASAVMTVKLGFPFWIAVPLSGCVGVIAGLIYCYLLGLRLTGFYLAIGTFALGEALITLGLNSDYLGGAIGLVGIPLASSGPWIFGVLAISLFAVWRLEQSRFGLAMRAIRDNQTVAGPMGINVTGTKMLAWTIGGFITGMGGALHAHRVTVLTPTEFSIFMSLTFVLAPLLGGLRTFWGTVLGGLLVYFLPWITTTDEPRDRLMFYGIIIVLLMVFRPQGIFPATPVRSAKERGQPTVTSAPVGQ